MGLWKRLTATKSLEMLHAEMQGDNRLRRVLGPIGLTSLGVGAIIGAGIFVLTGEVAAFYAGPGILISFVITAVCCLLAALCYAEFASMAPVAGSAYTYAYTTLGELLAWIIGWDLILEYAMSAATVAASWSKYFNQFTEEVFGLRFIAALSNDPFADTDPGIMNLPAVLILLACTAVLVIGIKESAASNTALVVLKVGVVLFVIVAGAMFFKIDNWTSIPSWQRKFPEEHLFASEGRGWAKKHEKLAGEALEERTKELAGMALALHKIEIARKFGTPEQVQETEKRYGPDFPEDSRNKVAAGAVLAEARKQAPEEAAKSWGMLGLLGVNDALLRVDDNFRSSFMPYGLSGIMFGAAFLFFVYLGFDAVSTHSEEAINPQRDVPIGILGSLFVCTVLYMGVAIVLIGMVPYPEINPETAISSAFQDSKWVRILVAAGALAGMTSVLLITFLSQARIFLAMARDGLLPHRVFGAVHEKYRTPHISTMVTGGLMCVVAAFTPIRDLEAMVNIGTYFAFIVVCAAVLLLRMRRSDAARPFRVPWVYVVAPLGIFVNLLMMLFLSPLTWARLGVWLLIGFVIYFGFGYRYSVLGQRRT